MKDPKFNHGFNAGTIAALAVITIHDAETLWCDTVSAAGPKELIRHALTNEGDWQWAGFGKYAGRNFPKELREVRAELRKAA